MQILIRDAAAKDATEVVRLTRELAQAEGESTLISPEYVVRYLSHPGCCILLAELGGQVVGLLSYSIRPDLYHAADCCLIEELIVGEQARRQGVGSVLVQEAIRRAAQGRCAEISVSTMPDNLAALRFYRRHGLVDEAILLERHLEQPSD